MDRTKKIHMRNVRIKFFDVKSDFPQYKNPREFLGFFVRVFSTQNT